MLLGSFVIDKWHNWHRAQLGASSQGMDPKMDRVHLGLTPAAVMETNPRMQSAISVSVQGKMAGLSEAVRGEGVDPQSHPICSVLSSFSHILLLRCMHQ